MKKKVCVIGTCGHVGQALRVLQARDDIDLCGVAPGSPYETVGEDFAEILPLFGNWRQMLDEVRPALAVVSPVFGLTGEVIAACAERKISVFSEKPVAVTLPDLERVERAVKESGVAFCAMHYLRYAPAFYHAAEMVRAGAIGEVRLVTAQKSYKYGTRPVWYGDRALYGGTIPWVGIHAIDWIYHFTGKRFLSVSARTFGKDPEMSAVCQFELEGGIPASINLDYYRPASAPTHDDDRIRVAGTEGVLEVCDGRIRLMNGEGVQTLEPTEAPELLTQFLDGGEVISPEEIFYLTRVAILARDAADRREPLRMED